RGLAGTLTPPNVEDDNPNAFLIATPSGTTLEKYTLSNPASSYYSALTGPTAITLPHPDTVPPSAPQPGTAEVLETSDMRFSSDTTQYGNTLWAANSVDFAG